MNSNTLDCTPSWSNVVVPTLDLITQKKVKPEDLKMIYSEFIKMAKAADLWNEYRKQQTGE